MRFPILGHYNHLTDIARSSFGMLPTLRHGGLDLNNPPQPHLQVPQGLRMNVAGWLARLRVRPKQTPTLPSGRAVRGRPAPVPQAQSHATAVQTSHHGFAKRK